MVFNKSNQRKGAQGIGTLIIFIALILVAAVAAGVLIQTASSLQSKSLDVGRQSQEKITTDIEVVQVYAADTADGLINGTAAGSDTITMIVRLGSGSSPINLDDLIVKMDTQSGSQTLQYDVAGPASVTLYTVSYVSNNATAGTPGYLVTGDLAQVTFLNANDVNEGETATIRLLTKNGAVKPVQMTTPSAMVEVTTYLFP
jgi:flagellin FlaB